MSRFEDLAQRRAQLSAAKKALLERWVQGETAAVGQRPTIPRRAARARVPLTFAQQRLWFLDQVVPASAAYTIAEALRLNGALQVSLLEESFSQLVGRHAALRTTFVASDGQPIQVCAPPRPVQLPLLDLRALDEGARRVAMEQLVAREAGRPFDLARGPLLRVTLLRLGAQEHLLLLSLHHIICDGWSIGILLRELSMLYAAGVSGQPASLPDLPIQYADVACWQRQQGLEPDEQLTYWKQRLAQAPARLDLPTDRPRPAVQSLQGARLTFTLPAALAEALQQLCRREGVTLFMLLLTAWQILLFRLSGQQDLVIGTPIANRTRVELEGLIGLFANTLALRCDLAGDPQVRELLQRTRACALAAYEHQDLPFEQLVEALSPARDLSRNPLFQVMFVLQNAPLQAPHLPGLTFEPLAVENHTTKFDLWLSLTEGPRSLGGSIEYSTDLFEAASIARLLEHFQVVLVAVVRSMEQRISQLPLLSAAEEDLVVRRWNATRRAYPPACLPRLIEAALQRTPQAVALIYEEQHLSCGELNRRANRLARHLQDLGVGPEVVVAVQMQRSPAQLITLLAILKAGGAYLPLDPTYPHVRLRFLLADARAALLVIEEAQTALADTGIPTLCLPAAGTAIARQAGGNLKSRVHPAAGAYVLYTSGSTGQPKGVVNTQRGICNRLQWMQEACALQASDRVLYKTPLSFDVSVWECFWPLLAGAPLVMARPEGQRDSAYLVELIACQQVTTVHFVPSLLQVFLEEPGLARCRSLRRVICSGEVLPSELLERFQDCLEARLYNLYGPTEAAIDVAWWACERVERPLPIGRPIANVELYILDSGLRPQPIGVPGELYIGGVGLARGYLSRPDLTAACFLPDPYGGVPGMRLYRTGDRARLRPDGAIEFLGRLDEQVKLRGQRIEPGEIEATIAGHPDVRECLVQVREDTPGHRQLVAYLVAQASFTARTRAGQEAGLPAEQLAHWRAVFDATYAEPALVADPAHNLVGWTSSYTGLPIPAAEMQEWIESTCARIRTCRPERILEIGCGSGLLLLRLAPHCTSYVATDFSQEALGALRQHLRRRPLPQVHLLHRPAHDYRDLPPAGFDLVILNSVVQYFPDVDYLLQVLTGALTLLRPGGTLFVGDVRHLGLLTTLHSAVELQRAAPTLASEQLQRRIQLQVARESELLLDPRFFCALARQERRICRVDVQLKRGRAHNELTQFRYDALLHVEAAGPPPSGNEPLRLDWQQERLSVAGLRQRLLSSTPALLLVTGIPNARLQDAVQVQRLLASSERPASVGALRQALPARPGVEPEDLWALGDELPYEIAVRWSATGADGCFEALLWRRAPGGKACFPAHLRLAGDPLPWQSCANAPLQEKLARRLSARVQSYLQERLPASLLPAVYVLLERFPLLPNGKRDRQGLAAPPPVPVVEGETAPPRTPGEEILAAIWAEVLGLEEVGIHHNFFELGGDSIRSILVIARAQRAGLLLSARQMFQAQTIAELAAVASSLPAGAREQEPLAPFALLPQEPASLQPLFAARGQIEDSYPLGPLQARMLACYRSAPAPGLYAMQRIALVQGELNAEAFARGWQQVIDRHALLRTSFAWEGLVEPLQLVHTEATLTLEQQDWRALSPVAQEQHLQAYLHSVQAHGLQLEQPCILRLLVARVAGDIYRLVISTRYISVDGWSFTMLNSEALIFYDALCQGRVPPPLPRGRPFRDYLAWLARQDLSVAESFWRQELQDLVPAPSLLARTGETRGLPEGAAGAAPGGFARQGCCLAEEITQSLRTQARRAHLTPNTFVQGAWALLLSAYTASQEVVFGTSVSGRSADLRGVESITGVLMNILPTRLRVPPERLVLSWLSELQDQQVRLRQYEHTPLQKIYEWCQIPQERLLFESYLVFQNLDGLGAGASLRHLSALRTLRALPTPQQFVARQEYPLRLDAFPGAQMELVLSYYQRCFSDATIAAMLAHLSTLLASVATNPQQRIGDLLRLLPAG
ncbi:MAG TPA: amino acid adenylation domain-containing protein [Ktedonobacteraceae bacterium]